MPFEAPPAAHAAALWSGLLLILLLVLSARVVQQRRMHRVAQGHEGHPPLEGALRAFGNATEYIPAAIGALAVLAIAGAYPPIVHLTGAVLFVGRAVHAVGLSRNPGVSNPRAIGTLLTWIAYVFAAVALLFYAIA